MSDYVAGKAWIQEKYDRIVQSAFMILVERGIEQDTMPEVAKGDVLKSSLLLYSPSKKRACGCDLNLEVGRSTTLFS